MELWKDDLFRKLSLLISLGFFANALVYYGISLGAATLPGNIFVNNIINSVIDISSCLLTFFIMFSIRRRTLLACGLIIGGVSCLICAFLFQTSTRFQLGLEIGRWISFIGKFCSSSSFR